MDSHYLFVYGTLCRAFSCPASSVMTTYCQYVSTAFFQGKLYDLGDYPGVVASDNPADQVKGEVYYLKDKPQALRLLDKYEGCRDSDPLPHEYQRTIVSITNDEQQVIQSWIYLLTEARGRLIFSGDYLRYCSADPQVNR